MDAAATLDDLKVVEGYYGKTPPGASRTISSTSTSHMVGTTVTLTEDKSQEVPPFLLS
jgi:hypothetical protein